MELRSCIIVSGGRQDTLPHTEGAFVIACDRGLAYCMERGVRPDLFVGDFDSYHGAVPAGVETVCLPVMKDDTDTGYAVRTALARGFSRLTLVCALGGRLDHTLANLQTCADAAARGAEVRIESDSTQIRFLADGGSLELARRAGWSLSVFAASDRAEGVTIMGVKYPLQDAALTNRFPLGVSNEITAPTARISLTRGSLIVVCSRMGEPA